MVVHLNKLDRYYVVHEKTYIFGYEHEPNSKSKLVNLILMMALLDLAITSFEAGDVPLDILHYK
ncbi:MAG: hypothetical protein GY797_23340 [Deltaproteobacteria bacterium]|nr:hypothetical protein [Deltaproteobacteria bacterium]